MRMYRYSDSMASNVVSLPDPNELVMEGVYWGEPYQVPSAAFWAFAARESAQDVRFNVHPVSSSFLEQVAYCLLGGYGMSAELGVAAFRAIALEGLIRSSSTVDELEIALSRPLKVGSRIARYRFPRQKARYLRSAIVALAAAELPTDPRDVRDVLRGISGIGFKTASWIVRDWYGSDDVAIIDVHIERACRAINVFWPSQNLTRDYREMEDRYLTFARAIGVCASRLDNVMWKVMREEGKVLASRTAGLS